MSNCVMYPVFTFLLILSVKSAVYGDINANIVNLEVHSVTDLRDQFADAKTTIIFENKNPHDVLTYTYVIDDPGLYSIKFSIENKDELPFKKTQESHLTYFEVTLSNPVAPKKNCTLLCKITYAEKIVPAYKKRRSAEDQVMIFEGSNKFFSVYHTKYSKVEFVVSNEALLEVTPTPSYYTKKDTLVFVSDKVKTLDSELVEIVFINNKPFVVIKDLNRLIDVSHFGKITIQDDVIIENCGAKFVGPYESSDHNPWQIATTEWLYTHLPASAEDIQFFDILGNNSLSSVYNFDDFKTLKFATRYPLKGGWKSEYSLRYTVPLHEYIFLKNKNFLLNIRAIDYVVGDKVIENAVIRIALPEGARIVHVDMSEIFKYGSEDGFWTSLTVWQRRVVLLEGKRLFKNYVEDVRVEYFLSSWYLVKAPFMIALYLELVFVFIIFSKRLVFIK